MQLQKISIPKKAIQFNIDYVHNKFQVILAPIILTLQLFLFHIAKMKSPNDIYNLVSILLNLVINWN